MTNTSGLNTDFSAVSPPDVSPIIDYLRNKATEALGASLGAAPLVSFCTGGQGNFPYYYNDPANLNFNQLTYDWINTNLLNNVPPVQQSTGSTFSNLFLQVLSKVSYSLSTADKNKLNAAYSNAQNQQMAVLQAWKAQYGSFPPGSGQPIDNIMSTICTTWASPSTTLVALQNSINMSELLNNAPASGQTIMPVVASYLDALGDSVTLANSETMNNAYVKQALRAVQTPSASNGGLVTNDGTGKLHPSYSITTSLSSIINSLSALTNTITISMSVSIASESEYSVSINGGASFRIPFLDFFSLGVGGNSSYFHEEIVKNSSSVNMTMTFTGPTLVQYTPKTYDLSTGLYWFYMEPILEAIKNANQDVSGYKFSPSPGIDFGSNGPFGLLQGIAIANYPSVKIDIKSSSYQSIQTTFQQTISTSISFLGIPLGGSTESTYSHSASSDASQSEVSITLNPPATLVAGTSTQSVGWVLGVQTNYPAASV